MKFRSALLAASVMSLPVAVQAQAIDGPYFDIADVDGLRARAARARSLGYDGKWALHPSQIAPLNEVFSPTPAEFEQASGVLDELERAEQVDGRGAVLLDGQMIDEAMRKQAAQIVARLPPADRPSKPS